MPLWTSARSWGECTSFKHCLMLGKAYPIPSEAQLWLRSFCKCMSRKKKILNESPDILLSGLRKVSLRHLSLTSELTEMLVDVELWFLLLWILMFYLWRADFISVAFVLTLSSFTRHLSGQPNHHRMELFNFNVSLNLGGSSLQRSRHPWFSLTLEGSYVLGTFQKKSPNYGCAQSKCRLATTTYIVQV